MNKIIELNQKEISVVAGGGGKVFMLLAIGHILLAGGCYAYHKSITYTKSCDSGKVQGKYEDGYKSGIYTGGSLSIVAVGLVANAMGAWDLYSDSQRSLSKLNLSNIIGALNFLIQLFR